MSILDDYPVVTKALVVVVFAPIFIAGVVGNLLVIWVVVRNRRMHTATNIFIGQLAVGDLMTVFFCMPFTLTGMFLVQDWVFGNTVCRMVRFCQAAAVYITIITLVAMSIERYFVLLRPLQARTLWNKKSAMKAGAIIYLVSILLALPRLLLAIVEEESLGKAMGNETTSRINSRCIVNFPSNLGLYYDSFRIAILYVLPVILISILYTKIALHLKNTGMNAAMSNEKVAQARKKVAVMLAAMVSIFAICWMPFNGLLLIGMVPEARKHFDEGKWGIWYQFFTAFFMYFNCISNPILYTFMSSQYRKGFREIVGCKKKKEVDTDGSSSKPTKSEIITVSRGKEEKPTK